MCGACRPVPADRRLRGPADRQTLARAVESTTGLRTRVVIGQWTVSTSTGRQVVCATPEEVADAAARATGGDASEVLARAWAAVARNGPRQAASG